jgi:hypothetical protein
MSLVILNSKGNGSPSRFNCAFPNGVLLDANSQVCCMSWTGKRTAFDEGISINSYNDSLCWSVQDCENTNPSFPNVPFEKCSIPHGNYDVFSYQDLANKITTEMNDKEVLSAYKGGWLWQYAGDKFSVALNRMSHVAMDMGAWRQYYGTSGTASITTNNVEAPILSIADMKPGDISMNYVANSVSTTLLTPGEINNTNGIYGNPIAPATMLGIHTTDANGVNQASILANMVGRSMTCISTDTTSPGRNTTYSFWTIMGISSYLPPAPAPISAATHIQFDVIVVEQNLDVPNPSVGYAGVPHNWFATETLTLIFGAIRDINAASITPGQDALNFYDANALFNTTAITTQTAGTIADPSGYSFSIPITPATTLSKIEGVIGGFITNQYFQYTSGTDNTRNPDMDWSNPAGSNRAKVSYGFTIGSDFKLKALVGSIEQDQFSQNNFSQTEIDISAVNLDAARDTIDVILQPIHNNTAADFKYGWELLYRFKTTDPYTFGHALFASNGKYAFLNHLPLRQVLSYKDENQMTTRTKAIHNADTPAVLDPTFPTWNVGMSIATQDSFPDTQSDWLTFVNNNATIGDTLNFFAGNHQQIGNVPIIADAKSNLIQELGTKPLLIQCPDLPITGYCQNSTPQILQMASGVNPYNSTESLLYEQFGNNNWIELKNKTQLNLTRLGIVITDVQNQEVNFLEDESVVCLKFRTNNQNIKLGGF